MNGLIKQRKMVDGPNNNIQFLFLVFFTTIRSYYKYKNLHTLVHPQN